MTDWLIEHAPTVTRAALIEDGAIVEARLSLLVPDRVRLGEVLDARWDSPRRINAGERVPAATLVAPNAARLYLPAPPPGTGPGATLRVEVVREAVWTPRGAKLAVVRPTEAPVGLAPDLSGRLLSPYAPDALEAAGWSELVEEAETGVVERGPVRLLIDVTEAMTLIDIDGSLPADELAWGGAARAAETIRRLDIGGNIGIDLPTVAGPARKAAADAFDAVMPKPFERTAVNGFGFLQVVRPLLRPSLLAIMRSPHARAERERKAWRARYDAYLHR